MTTPLYHSPHWRRCVHYPKTGPPERLARAIISQLSVIVSAYDYHMTSCKFLNPFIRPCEALVECKPDGLSVKSLNPEIGTLRGKKPYERLSQRVAVARLPRGCLLMLPQMSLERISFAEVAQSKHMEPVVNGCINNFFSLVGSRHNGTQSHTCRKS